MHDPYPESGVNEAGGCPVTSPPASIPSPHSPHRPPRQLIWGGGRGTQRAQGQPVSRALETLLCPWPDVVELPYYFQAIIINTSLKFFFGDVYLFC